MIHFPKHWKSARRLFPSNGKCLSEALKVTPGSRAAAGDLGTTIGADKDIAFAPVKARHIRLQVFKAARPININEFQVVAPERSSTP